MAFRLGAAVDRRVLRLVGEVMGLLSMDELCAGLLFALRQAIPVEFCAINEVRAMSTVRSCALMR